MSPRTSADVVTIAQRIALAELARGEPLARSGHHWYLGRHWIHRGTVQALQARQWIKEDHRGPYWTITPSGRAALERVQQQQR